MLDRKNQDYPGKKIQQNYKIKYTTKSLSFCQNMFKVKCTFDLKLTVHSYRGEKKHLQASKLPGIMTLTWHPVLVKFQRGDQTTDLWEENA